MTTTIVHISDTHFGTEVPAVVGAIERCIATLQPDLLLLSGDITQRARRKEFDSAAAFLERLPAKAKMVIPGNHDIPLYNLFARFITPYRNYKRAFGLPTSIWSNGEVAVVGYNATCPTRHTRGALEDKVVLRMARDAKAKLDPGGVLIAAVHQPLLTAKPEDADEILINANRTAHLFSEESVDIMLSGHVHFPLFTSTKEAYPDLPRPFLLLGTGTAISRRIRSGAPNSFNCLRITRELQETAEIEIEQYTYDNVSDEFIGQKLSPEDAH